MYRTGNYDRGLTTSSDAAAFRIPKLQGRAIRNVGHRVQPQVRGTVEEAMVVMCLTRASTRTIENLSEIERGSSVSTATGSKLDERHPPRSRNDGTPARECPTNLCFDNIDLKRS